MKLQRFTSCAFTLLIFVLMSAGFVRNNLSSGAAIAISLWISGAVFIYMNNQRENKRGRERIPYETARKRSLHRLKPDDKGFQWGGVTLPSTAKNKGFFFMGEMGSGKTLSLYLLMHEAFKHNPKAKGVIHDFKMNIAPFLQHIGIAKERIKILHPYDRRCIGWDIQKDCTDGGTAFDIASTLIPEDDPRARYFTTSARVLIAYVMRFYIYESRKRKKENDERKSKELDQLPDYRWTFRDVVEALRHIDDMHEMFTRYQQLSDGLDFLKSENADVTRTLKGPLILLQEIAGLWDAAEREGRVPISFRDWRDQDNGEILILGFDNERAESLSAVNRVMLHRLMKAVLGNTNREKPETWFFLDEFHALRRIPEFETFITTVREYRGCVAVATQNFLQVKRDYGEETTGTIMQELASKAFLKCSGDASRWGSTYIDEAEITVKKGSETISPQGLSTGTNREDQMHRLVLSSELSSLPMFEEFEELHGYYLTSYIGDVYPYVYTKGRLSQIWMRGGNYIDYQREEKDEKKELRPWDEKDRERLGLLVKTDMPVQPENGGNPKRRELGRWRIE